MKVLVVGGGGREHALVWKIAQSPLVNKIYCAPGNAGIASQAECAPIADTDIDAQRSFAQKNDIGLTVVGPEVPLTLGIVDAFQRAGLTIFGPSKAAAKLEGSKTFAKEIMAKYGVPTGAFRSFNDSPSAIAYLKTLEPPIVVKADGLAAGKGVTVAPDHLTAEQAVRNALERRQFGDAGRTVVIEEFLSGEEASILAFSDGHTVLPMPPSQDHKRAYDGDAGPNTGGMGAYAPAPVVTSSLMEKIKAEILLPTIRGMAAEGAEYHGVIYAGLMIRDGQAKVVEFNCRFGDPETQAVLPLMTGDIVPLLLACANGKLSDHEPLRWQDGACVCVVIASGGYPGEYQKGYPIDGLANATSIDGVAIFHAGTKFQQSRIVTAGGRVLGVTATNQSIKSAIRKAYGAIDRISFDRMHYRKDIGFRAIR